MKIGLIDYDSKIVNLAIMKLSAYYKEQGHQVVLNPFSPEGLDKTFVSVLFTQNKDKALELFSHYPNVEFGGTGYSLKVELPTEIESIRPDFNLYKAEDIFPRIASRIATTETKMRSAQEIVDAGILYTTRGCIRKCAFCAVPEKEGSLRQVAAIEDGINPRSNRLILLDNNLTADPLVLSKLETIKRLGLHVDITQGIDVRLVDDAIAHALSEVKHMRSLHYAWDIPAAESIVLKGVKTLSAHVKTWRHLCYVLAGFNSTFEEDVMRVRKLHELGVTPYVMRYINPHEYKVVKTPQTEYFKIRLGHFARWVNGKFFKTCSFNEYRPWVNARAKLPGAFGASQQELVFA
jgi:hypothetical protein